MVKKTKVLGGLVGVLAGFVVGGVEIGGVGGVGGCARPPGGFGSPEPGARLVAIMQAAHDRDQSAIPHLIESLDSDDSAVRLMAIGTLEELTGQTLGYRHEDPLWRRDQAVDRWVAWYDHPTTTAPPRPPADGPDRTPE